MDKNEEIKKIFDLSKIVVAICVVILFASKLFPHKIEIEITHHHNISFNSGYFDRPLSIKHEVDLKDQNKK